MLVHLTVVPTPIVSVCGVKEKSAIVTGAVPPTIGTHVAVALGGKVVEVAATTEGVLVLTGVGLPPPVVVTVSQVALMAPQLPKPP